MGGREGGIGQPNYLAREKGGRDEVGYVGGKRERRGREEWIGGRRVETGPAFRGREMRGSGLKIQV